ncbi:hypothetical protein GCM10027402_35580 [Arthrobacter monumenti]
MMKQKLVSVLRHTVQMVEIFRLATLSRFATATDVRDNERGDVPGWVMITLMSAVLVAGLLALAGPALEGLFQSAMNQVRQ